MDSDTLDCLIIGGGPAGLTSAIYLSRYRLHVRLVDKGAGRAALIPRSHNLPGFPGGISGSDLLHRLSAQAREFGTQFVQDGVMTLQHAGDLFVAGLSRDQLTSRTIILATGVLDIRPQNLPPQLHDEALAAGLLRYCPICDAYEARGRKIAVLGDGEHAVREAEFLRVYSDDITFIAADPTKKLDAGQTARLEGAKIQTVPGPALAFLLDGNRIDVQLPDGWMAFDTLYPALGSQPCSNLAAQVGAETSENGCIVVDARQETTVPGVFAAGDIVQGLDQISTAFGHAAKAATTIRNRLLAW